METHELIVLEAIKKHDYITQREIAVKVDLSLGRVNQLLKKFLKSGLLKMEFLDGKKVKYILTHAGHQHLSRLVMARASRSYLEVSRIKSDMASRIDRHFGKDEVIPVLKCSGHACDMLVELLEEMGRKYSMIVKPEPGMRFIGWTDDGGIQDQQHEGIMIRFKAKFAYMPSELNGRISEVVSNILKDVDIKQETDAAVDNSICDRCGGTMVSRTVGKGTKAGSQFLGCSNYPKCKNTIGLNE